MIGEQIIVVCVSWTSKVGRTINCYFLLWYLAYHLWVLYELVFREEASMSVARLIPLSLVSEVCVFLTIEPYLAVLGGSQGQQ